MMIGLESVKEEIRYYMDFIKIVKNIKNGMLNYQGVLLAGPQGQVKHYW